MPEFDPTSFPLVKKGNQYQDFEVGQVWQHHWGRTITEGDALLFTSATCNWNPMYINAEFAKAHGHPGLVVNPMLVLCTAVGMSVEDLSEGGGPFLGVEDCRFLAPVYPGDTLTAESVVLDKRESASRPQNGIVTWETAVRNQRGELVLQYRRTNLVAKRRDA
jgi:acyl dehydratase